MAKHALVSDPLYAVRYSKPTPLQLKRAHHWLAGIAKYPDVRRSPVEGKFHATRLLIEIRCLQRDRKTKEERLLLRAIKIWYEVQKLPPDSDDAYGLKGALDDLIRRAQLLYSLKPKARRKR